ncbi:MAG: STAS domain-containing protein [Planctomycetota bacterium]
MSLPKIFDTTIEGSTLIVTTRASAGSLAGDEMAFELAEILDRLERADLQNAVIDLGKSSYFGTCMLQVMTALWKRVRARGGTMALCNLSETGHEILRITRFDTLWPICSSRDDAVEAVTQ